MTFYGSALFVHVVFAILLVGGGAYTHVSLALAAHARSVDGARSHAMWLHVFVKAILPLAGVVLATGVYMAFAGSWWGAGWPVVSLVLFGVGGAAASALIDPRVARLRASLDQMPEGPLVPEIAAKLVDPTLRLAGWVLVGADLTIVLLMTNKPGWTGAVIAGVVGLTLGGAVGVLVNRTSRPLRPDVPTSTPPTARA